jgi:hypothetical protein
MATLADVLRKTGYSQGGTLNAPAPTAPTLTTILGEHIRTLPQQIEANQRAMDKTTAGMDKYDIFGKPNPNYYPEAMKEFTQNYLPAFMGATAWHGTPHKILNKFDISKVGTGEGAQAYGHGMYFAENPAVAKQYAITVPKTINNNAYSAENIAKRLFQGGFDEQYINKRLNLVYPNAKPDVITNAIENAKTGTYGNIYKVDIPDEHIPNMLNWDKPLTQQTPEVQAILKDRFPSAFDDPRQATGQALYKEQVKKMGMSGQQNPEQFMSNYLNEYGIKGIRYLDEGSRKTGGTSNFVVFDPSTVKILEENAKPISRKALIEKQVKDLKD